MDELQYAARSNFASKEKNMNAQRRRSSSFLGLAGCGCRNSKSVAVSSSSSDAKSMIAAAAVAPAQRRPHEATSSGETLTMTSPSTSSYWDPEIKMMESSASTPSVSGLLRQLGELEQDVASWGQCTPPPPEPERKRRHKRSFSEGCGRRVEEESVAVVKETKDPLGEFRRSMLQMIVEKEIVDSEELQDLLRRLLTLNEPQHHTAILQAFAEIWEEVFAGYDHTPVLLHRGTAPRLAAPRRA